MSTISANQRSSTNYLSFILSGISISFLSDVNHQREPMIFNQLSFFHIIWYFYFFLVRCQPSARTNDLQPTIFLSYYLVFLFLSCQMSTISANQQSSTIFLSYYLVFQFVRCQPSVRTNDLQPTIFLSYS